MLNSIYISFERNDSLCVRNHFETLFAEAVIVAYLNSYVVPYVRNQKYFPYDVNNASLIVDLTSNTAYPFLQVR